jgi:hypothetical protein
MVRARSGRDATLPGDCCPMAIRERDSLTRNTQSLLWILEQPVRFMRMIEPMFELQAFY